MKLLIITQKIDIDDDLLGFMHGWIKEFSKYYEKITVICLGKGRYELPANVRILSLGKENGKSRMKYLVNFYKYIWTERKNYDAVFVHMNKEYVILGGVFWKLWGKKVSLWYNHLKGNIVSKIGGKMADVIFYTSPYSYFSKKNKAKIMPVGIDTDIFLGNEKIKKEKNSIVYLGRISPVKNLDILVEAANVLNKRGIVFILNIAGAPGENDSDYFDKINKSAENLKKAGKIKFLGKIPNFKTPEIYNQNEIFVNLTDSGSFDKTTMEAMACESLVLASNKSFEKIFPGAWHDLMIFKEKDGDDLAEKINKLFNLSDEEKNDIAKKSREIIIESHSLKILSEKISGALKI